MYGWDSEHLEENGALKYPPFSGIMEARCYASFARLQGKSTPRISHENLAPQ